jgi:hypothetical protein
MVFWERSGHDWRPLIFFKVLPSRCCSQALSANRHGSKVRPRVISTFALAGASPCERNRGSNPASSSAESGELPTTALRPHPHVDRNDSGVRQLHSDAVLPTRLRDQHAALSRRRDRAILDKRPRSVPHRLPDGIYDERPCFYWARCWCCGSRAQRLRWCPRSDRVSKLCRSSIDRIGPAGRALLSAGAGILRWAVI